MPQVTYKDASGRVRKAKTAYTEAGKKRAKKLAKRLGGKVTYTKPKKRKKSKARGKRV